jgi:hypothetical protein
MRWSLLLRRNAITSIPRRVIDQFLSTLEARIEDGLKYLLSAATTLVAEGVFSEEDLARLAHTLSVLREDTKYSSVLLDSRRAVSISLVRQQCVLLADTLQQKIPDDETLDAWLEEGRSDPLPEVRFCLQGTR